ncbi:MULTISPECIES: nuclear transport factor 2 family protein [Burkholderia]|uniref:nuclear transport factor 2 family protein n=1 Tax=Burkholderia TaxID=32008 RepID=UPI000B1744F9|nr:MULTISPECIES: nuclear transport factor 2 family protein [Burkholderia]
MERSQFTHEQRLARLEDIEAIKYLKAQYAEHLDNGYDPEGVASLFVEDSLWVIKGVGGEARGREEIKQHCRNLSKNIRWALHNIVSPAVDVDEEDKRATATFYLVCFVTMAGSEQSPQGEAIFIAGKYKDRLVKTDGKWYSRKSRAWFSSHRRGRMDGWKTHSSRKAGE